MCLCKTICCHVVFTSQRSVTDHVTVSAVNLWTECGKLCDKCSSELKEPSGTAMYVVKGPQRDVTCLCWPEATISLLWHGFNTLLQMQGVRVCSTKKMCIMHCKNCELDLVPLSVISLTPKDT